MFISDLTKLCSKEACVAFARKLDSASKEREESFSADDKYGHYTKSIDECAHDDYNVAIALRASWNECQDFIAKMLGSASTGSIDQ